MCTFQPVFKSPLQQPAPSLTLTTRSVTDEGLGTMRRGLKWLVICMWFMLENIWRHKWHFIWPFSSLLVLNHECEVLLPSSAPYFTLKPEVRGGGKKKKKGHELPPTEGGDCRLPIWECTKLFWSLLSLQDNSWWAGASAALTQYFEFGSQGHKAPSN